MLAGGDTAVVDRVIPVLEALGTVRRCGGSGSGAALKLVLATALVTGVTALADTLAVARAVGVDRETALEVLLGRTARWGWSRGPPRTGASFAIALAAKDIDLALRELEQPTPRSPELPPRVLQDAQDQSADLGTIVTKELA